ncbi:hypothetical protein DH2020_043527 [Rehmannia glutinosa]|uniref:ASCH domain-containing protein n=1 Tax=Rehmannia glutinosa TaxID=99300 RepID=A0ABR0UKB0_REHGL
MGSRRIESSNYRNPCLTMHQPWASLLVYGIKRIEGRSWPAPIRGPRTRDNQSDGGFLQGNLCNEWSNRSQVPEHYPVSRLLGCVDVVGCVTCEELVSWEDIPASVNTYNIKLILVRLEGQTAFCWLCEQPQIYEAAVRGLSSVKAPQPVKFPLPDPRDPFSLKPGSLASRSNCSSLSQEEKSPSLVAAIAGARAAATQFSKNNTFQPPTGDSIEGNEKPASSTIHHSDAS